MNAKPIDLLENITNYFLESSDYNGIPLITLFKKLELKEADYLAKIENLITEDKISLQFGNLTENPHIIRFCHFPHELQIENLKKDKLQNVCAYPSESHLKETVDTSLFLDKPFSLRLALGEAHVKPVFFELDVLERYFHDPRYAFKFDDYSGQIYIHSDFYDSEHVAEKDKIFLKSFGLGYDEKKNRVIVVYNRYLDDFTPEHQKYWTSKEIKSDCKVVSEYIDNTMQGIWVTSHSLFSAFISEQKIINELVQLIGKPKLFRETFEDNRPREFTFFLSPTLKNYESFISLLDKMLSDNLNKEFFRGDIQLTEKIEINNNEFEIRHKGTIQLLDEWLRKNFKLVNEEGYNVLLKPFKSIRRQRQSPAHKIQQNFYDAKYFENQMDIMEQAYRSLNGLRIIFSQHPKAESYTIPRWLKEGNIKIF